MNKRRLNALSRPEYNMELHAHQNFKAIAEGDYQFGTVAKHKKPRVGDVILIREWDARRVITGRECVVRLSSVEDSVDGRGKHSVKFDLLWSNLNQFVGNWRLPKPSESVDRLQVLTICCAYEQGVGQAGRSDVDNPYNKGTEAWEAYKLGRDQGDRMLARNEIDKVLEELHTYIFTNDYLP